MKYYSPEARLLRYVGKLWDNRNNPVYMQNPHVQKILDGGKPNIEKVKAHFIERGIVTADEFDQAVLLIRGQDLMDTIDFKTNANGLTRFANIETQRQADLAAIGEFDTGTEEEKNMKRSQLDALAVKDY